ncbi:MAG: fluoride efflux transporter CrcB [Alphaproteobacteria bacterium]|nr:fluoride efflux transporter CrcB [Alphaproteobacteria bacterium]
MISTIGAVALGGAIGATGRYGVGIAAVKLLGHGFPWGTMVVNIAGSFAMGLIIAGLAHMDQSSQELRAFLTVGLLGGFTTFSAFSLDAVTLYERGALLAAGGYALASVTFSVLALFAGLILMRGVLPS